MIAGLRGVIIKGDMDVFDDFSKTDLVTPCIQHRVSSVMPSYLIRLFVSSIMPGLTKSEVA